MEQSYKKGEEVKRNTFALEYVCYADCNTHSNLNYTHLRVLKRKGKDQIQMIDISLNDSEENNRKRLLVRRLSKRFKEMDDFLKNCEMRKNLAKLSEK